MRQMIIDRFLQFLARSKKCNNMMNTFQITRNSVKSSNIFSFCTMFRAIELRNIDNHRTLCCGVYSSAVNVRSTRGVNSLDRCLCFDVFAGFLQAFNLIGIKDRILSIIMMNDAILTCYKIVRMPGVCISYCLLVICYGG